MRNHHLKFHHVSFSYDSTSTPLLQDVTFHLASGWTGVIGANGAGKTTLLRLATGLSQPEEGVIDIPPRTLYVPQRTDDPPEQLCQLLADPEKEAILVKDRLKLQPDWGKRWETLSHGERKRAQMAVALWENPEVLAIDEPTNHIDAEAREIIAAALYHFKGIGLLVSHDRALLDRLCHQCLFVEPPGIILRLGGVTKGFEIQKAEQAAIQKEQGQRKRAYQVLRREMLRRREIANQKRSKRGIAARDHDAKEKIDRARVSGKDAIGGKLLRQLQGRLTRTAQQVAELHVKKKISFRHLTAELTIRAGYAFATRWWHPLPGRKQVAGLSRNSDLSL